MKKHELTKAIAREQRLRTSQVADGLDRLIHDLVKSLRQGKPAELPGLGKLQPAPKKPRPLR
jgi:nucleoid DNA-binding protein